jgi:hypothetical protein
MGHGDHQQLTIARTLQRLRLAAIVQALPADFYGQAELIAARHAGLNPNTAHRPRLEQGSLQLGAHRLFIDSR